MAAQPPPSPRPVKSMGVSVFFSDEWVRTPPPWKETNFSPLDQFLNQSLMFLDWLKLLS